MPSSEDGLIADGGEELPEFEDIETDDTLMLQCWNCPNEFESGSLGRPAGQRDASELCPRCGAQFAMPPVPEQEFDDVVREPNQLPKYVLPHDEVKARVPAVKHIVDKDIRAEVVDLTARAPAYFWSAPAANPTSDYHHPVCRQRYGLWAHTLMGVTIVKELAESWVEQDRITVEERDHALAASILHDQRKKGPHGAFNGSSTSNHDLRMAEVVRKRSGLPDEVSYAIETHMGPWYDGPAPDHAVEHLVHNADMLASTPNVTPRVTGPLHDLLEDMGLEVIGDAE